MAHVENIEKNRDILLRCININVQIVACLRAAEVIDEVKESRLDAEKAHHDKLCRLIDWIKDSSYKVYESFLQVMEENEQQHVVNLLKGNGEDNHVPLSLTRHARLLKIRPKLMYMIHNNAALIAALKGLGAISQTDAEDLSVDKVPNYKKNYRLIGAILRRSDHSFECLHNALRNTRQSGSADYLKEGEVIAIHVNTTQPDSDEKLSELLNATLIKESMEETIVKEIQMNESMDETTVKEIQIPQLNGLRIVGATPGHSIIIFVYCKTTENMVTFTQLFNSGDLQIFLQDNLNRLFARIEPKSRERLEACANLDEEEILAIEEITGIEDWMEKQCKERNSPRSEGLLASCKLKEEEEKANEISSATPTRSQLYWRQERRAFYENFDRLLTEEEELLKFFLPEKAPSDQDRNWKQRRVILSRGFETLLEIQSYILKSLIPGTSVNPDKFSRVVVSIEAKLKQQQESWRNLKRHVLLDLREQRLSAAEFRLAYNIIVEHQGNRVIIDEAVELLLKKVRLIRRTLKERKQMTDTGELFLSLENQKIEVKGLQQTDETQQRRRLKFEPIQYHESLMQRQLHQTKLSHVLKVSLDDAEFADRYREPLDPKYLLQCEEFKRFQPELTKSVQLCNESDYLSYGLRRHFRHPSATNPEVSTAKSEAVQLSNESDYPSYLLNRYSRHPSATNPEVSTAKSEVPRFPLPVGISRDRRLTTESYVSHLVPRPHYYSQTLSRMIGHHQSDATSSASSASSVSSGYSSRTASTEIIIGSSETEFSNLVQTIRTKAAEEEGKCIIGLTILDKELFVVSGNSSEVEGYNSLNFNFRRRWILEELVQPFDIASCNKNSCLYIMDHKRHGVPSEILKVDGHGILTRTWSTESDWGYGLSVTDECNIILAVHEKNKLNEYSPDGTLIREIHFSPDSAIAHPWHAIKLQNGDFVVSHGSRKDPEHRVCKVDAVGRIKTSFGGKTGAAIGQLNGPWYLAVDEKDSVIVSDWNNKRVLLLDSDLKLFKRALVPKKTNGLRDPRRIHLDRSSGRLFVTDNEYDSEAKAYKNGRILVFNVEDTEDHALK